jgi:putative tricarboxylic transport membrane protein
MSSDRSSSLIWLAIAVLICLESFSHLKLGTLHAPGPGFFPFWGGLLLGMFSLLLLADSLRSRVQLAAGVIPWRALLLVLTALLAYLLLLETAGFVLVTFFFLLLLFRFAITGWGRRCAWALVTTSVAYAFFQLWLKVQLPRGSFGI